MTHFSRSAKHLNGKLHWSTMQRDSSRWGISYFDLEREEHGLVELPTSMDWRVESSVGVIDGCAFDPKPIECRCFITPVYVESLVSHVPESQ